MEVKGDMREVSEGGGKGERGVSAKRKNRRKKTLKIEDGCAGAKNLTTDRRTNQPDDQPENGLKSHVSATKIGSRYSKTDSQTDARRLMDCNDEFGKV